MTGIPPYSILLNGNSQSVALFGVQLNLDLQKCSPSARNTTALNPRLGSFENNEIISSIVSILSAFRLAARLRLTIAIFVSADNYIPKLRYW